MLEFNAKNHTYTLDGEPIPSVSEITRFLHKEVYDKDIDKTILDAAADRGTRVHAATVELDESGTVDIDSDIEGYVIAYVKFMKEHEVHWKAKEQMSHRGTQYAGTFDRYGDVDGIPTLVDFKTTSNITGKHKLLYAAQLTLYSWMEYFCDVPLERKFVLHLKKDGTYKILELGCPETLVESILCLDEQFRKLKRRKKVLKNG